MSNKEAVIKEIKEIPEPLLEEVLDFVHFLKAKITKERPDTAIASESVLKKDWLKPEEDEAPQYPLFIVTLSLGSRGSPALLSPEVPYP